jgi:hypothetical protein
MTELSWSSGAARHVTAVDAAGTQELHAAALFCFNAFLFFCTHAS